MKAKEDYIYQDLKKHIVRFRTEADVAYFAEGWDEARGCKIEHTCAVEYNIDRIEG